jgi:hypothetical protein
MKKLLFILLLIVGCSTTEVLKEEVKDCCSKKELK